MGGVHFRRFLLYLVGFEYGSEKGVSSNQLTTVKQERSTESEEAEEVNIPSKHIETVNFDKGFYQEVYVYALGFANRAAPTMAARFAVAL